MGYTKVGSLTAKDTLVPMSRMVQIKIVLEEIEELKKQILLTEFNENMPYVIKTRRLNEMRESLFLTEHMALKIMQDEIDACDPPEEDGNDQ